MRNQLSLAAFIASLALALPTVASADRGAHGGFHAPAHGGPAVHGGVRGGPLVSGRYGGPHVYGAQHYYGPRYYGHYGRGYYGRPYYGYRHYGPGWYGALAIGTFVATLPLYYDSFWWSGVRYYYDDDGYYRWNSSVSQYEVVAPPNAEAAAASDAGEQVRAGARLFVYPKDGQSDEQQKTDRYECHRWAADQTNYDPTQASAQDTAKRDDYARAETACLTGRGYSVK
jgi:hypothetical protein